MLREDPEAYNLILSEVKFKGGGEDTSRYNMDGRAPLARKLLCSACLYVASLRQGIACLPLICPVHSSEPPRTHTGVDPGSFRKLLSLPPKVSCLGSLHPSESQAHCFVQGPGLWRLCAAIHSSN